MNSDNYVDSEKPVETKKDEKVLLNIKNFIVGLQILSLGIVIGLALYGSIWWAVSSIGLHYALTAIVAAIFTLVLLFTYEKVVKVNVDKIQASIFLGILIFFLTVILNGYTKSNNDVNKNYNQIISTSSETGNLRSVGDIWFTDKVFNIGQTVKFEVLYNNVKMMGGKIFSPGVYTFPENGKGFMMKGCLMFEGVVDKPAQVKVTY